MNYNSIFLIIGCLCCPFVDSANTFSKTLNTTSSDLLLNNLLATFLKTCDLNPKKVLFFDNSTELISSIVSLKLPISAILFSNLVSLEKLHRFQFNDLELDTVIYVIGIDVDYRMLYWLFARWQYNRNCIVYIFSNPLDNCDHPSSILEWMMRFYFSTSYYICLIDNHLIVYTHDPYGDTKPPYWRNVDQSRVWGKIQNIYMRSLNLDNTDMNELCLGFNFERTNSSKQVIVPTGIDDYQVNKTCLGKQKPMFSTDLEKCLRPHYTERVRILKKLLNLQFRYYFLVDRKLEYYLYGIDTMICAQSLFRMSAVRSYFYPIEYEHLAIMSHDQGFMTPLEKIAKYYGIWTLTSLIVITTMTFFVIRFITKNVSSALFDVIRLLINTGIIVPINTRTKKIFFSMIFLYFMVIHATFSGHLAEFLTKNDYRQNIETIEELKNPRIKTIYNFGYEYQEGEEFDVLREKSKAASHSSELLEAIHEVESAYIAPLVVLDLIRRQIRSDIILYYSKKTIGLTLISSTYRPGFPLSEKFNWALMYMFDRGLTTMKAREYRHYVFKTVSKRKAAFDVHHRPISLEDLYFAFILLAAGNLIAIICFLIETNLKTIRKAFVNLRCKNNEVVARSRIQPS